VRVHGPACERERDLGHLVEVTHDFKHHLPRQNFESPQIGPGSEVGDEVCVQMSAEGWQLLQRGLCPPGDAPHHHGSWMDS
jgi:hypothetical protein